MTKGDKMATIIYRVGLNREAYSLVAKKTKGVISLIRTDYINDREVKSIFTNHPFFTSKKEANAWIKKESSDSYKRDKEFMNNYR